MTVVKVTGSLYKIQEVAEILSSEDLMNLWQQALEARDAALRERDEARRAIVVLMENVLRAMEAPVDHAWLSDAQESVVEEARLMVAHRDGALRERDEARTYAAHLLGVLDGIEWPDTEYYRAPLPVSPRVEKAVEEWSRIYPSVEVES